MHTATRPGTSNMIGAISLVLGLVVSMLALLVGPAMAVGNNNKTCATFDGGTYTKYESDSSGAWGTIKFTQDAGDLDLTVNEGWQVELCLKKGTEPIHAADNPYREGSYAISYPGSDDGFSHYGIKFAPVEQQPDPTPAPSVQVDAVPCDETRPASRVTVTIDADGDEAFSVEVLIDGVSQGTISETTTFDGEPGSELVATWGEGESKEVDFRDCSTPSDPAPTVALSAACDETQPTATVTIDDDGDEAFSVEVLIDGVSQGTISETTTFEGSTLSVLRAVWGDDESDEVTFEDCTEDGPLLSTASFTTGSQCQESLPALTYDATISETADDPVGDVTLTVTDPNGVERAAATIAESDAGSLQLPTALEGATVDISWDFDDATAQQTLASGCTEVLGIVEEPDEDLPAALPTTEVKGEQVAGERLPNAGLGHVLLLVLGSGFLALGGSFLLLGDRRRGVFA